MRKWVITIVIALLLLNSLAQSNRKDQPYRYGFKAAYNLPLENDYSMISGDRSRSAEIGFYGGFGARFSGEVGLEIYFNKRYFLNSSPFLTSMIETRYMQIPIRGKYEFPFHKKQKIYGTVGIIYQQLINISINNIGYNKKMMTKSPFSLTFGVGYTYQFFSFELNYRHFLLNFDKDTSKNKQKTLSFAIYLAFI